MTDTEHTEHTERQPLIERPCCLKARFEASQEQRHDPIGKQYVDAGNHGFEGWVWDTIGAQCLDRLADHGFAPPLCSVERSEHHGKRYVAHFNVRVFHSCGGGFEFGVDSDVGTNVTNYCAAGTTYVLKDAARQMLGIVVRDPLQADASKRMDPEPGMTVEETEARAELWDRLTSLPDGHKQPTRDWCAERSLTLGKMSVLGAGDTPWPASSIGECLIFLGSLVEPDPTPDPEPAQQPKYEADPDSDSFKQDGAWAQAKAKANPQTGAEDLADRFASAPERKRQRESNRIALLHIVGDPELQDWVAEYANHHNLSVGPADIEAKWTPHQITGCLNHISRKVGADVQTGEVIDDQASE